MKEVRLEVNLDVHSHVEDVADVIRRALERALESNPHDIRVQSVLDISPRKERGK